MIYGKPPGWEDQSEKIEKVKEYYQTDDVEEVMNRYRLTLDELIRAIEYNES